MENKKQSEENFEGEETLSLEAREHTKATDEENEEVYPDAEVNISRESFSAFQLKRKHDQKPPMLKLDPEFQRELLWKENQKNELIESILMGIPLPLIYVKEDQNGVFIIVDGKQRLTTLFDFMNDKFSLKNLRMLQNINRKKFSELTQKQQNRIEECQLSLHVIKPPTKDRVTFDLFDRVNRGGTRLNNQEMRNALYQGNATELLKKLSASENFKEATENSIDTKRMKDRYLILRFIAFYLWRNKKLLHVKTEEQVEYKSDMEDFLSKTMLFLNNEISKDIIEKIPKIFEDAMGNCFNLFGEECFRLPKKKDKGYKRPINMALFETISYFAAKLKDNRLIDINKNNLIKEKYKALIQDDEYVFALTHAVDSNTNIKRRFEKIEDKIEEISNA